MNDKESITEVLGALAESQRNLTKAQAMLTVVAQSLMADIPRVQQPSEQNGCRARRYLGGDQEKSAKTKTKFKVDDKIEARYHGQSRYYPAVITAVLEDGTYCVTYDDGVDENKVQEKFIRSAKSKNKRLLSSSTEESGLGPVKIKKTGRRPAFYNDWMQQSQNNTIEAWNGLSPTEQHQIKNAHQESHPPSTTKKKKRKTFYYE